MKDCDPVQLFDLQSVIMLGSESHSWEFWILSLCLVMTSSTARLGHSLTPELLGHISFSVPLLTPFSFACNALFFPHLFKLPSSPPLGHIYLISRSLLKGTNLGKCTILNFGNLMNSLRTWVAEVMGSTRTQWGCCICDAMESSPGLWVFFYTENDFHSI